MRRGAPRRLSTPLGELTSALQPATTLARVQRVWPAAVGETIAAAARPIAERDGVLTVACADAVWSAELELMPTVLDSLNTALGEPLLSRLRCRTA